MTAFDDVRRKRTTVMLAASLAVLVAVIPLAYSGVKALRRYEGATKVSDVAIRIPPTPVGMLATVDAGNHLTSISLMVLQPNAKPGGSIVSVPVSVDSTLSVGPDRVPFTEVYANGGAKELALAVESALSVTLDVYQVADPAATEKLLKPLGTIEATLPTGAGKDFPVGTRSLSVAQVVQLINYTQDGQPDRSRRGNVEAVWAAIAHAVGQGLAGITPSASNTAAGAPPQFASLSDLMGILFSGPVGSRALSADIVDSPANPNAKDVEYIDRADAVMVFASIAPRSMSQPAPGLVYRIEAPAGYEAKMRTAVALILLGDANVQSVYLNGPTHKETVVLIRDERLQAQTVGTDKGLFGVTTFAKPSTPIEGIDVILQLGTDWLDAKPPQVTSTTATGASVTSTTRPGG